MAKNHVVLGTGAIGRAIMEELTRRGESVRMVNRSGCMAEVPAGVEVRVANLFDPASVREVTGGAAVAYQSAQPAYHRWVHEFPALQKSIIDGLAGSSTKLVLVENLYMYGETNGKPMTEDLPYNTQTRKGKVRGEISHTAFEAHRAGKIRVTAGRGSDYFGAWGLSSAAMGGRTFYPMLQGKPASLVGKIDLPHTHTYVKDFGRALVLLGERDEANGQAWHIPNDNPSLTQREMVQMIAAEMGIAPKMSVMGRVMMWFGGLFIPEAKETVEMMFEFEQPFIVDSSKFETVFGMKATQVKDAIRETVAWYRSHPEKKCAMNKC